MFLKIRKSRETDKSKSVQSSDVPETERTDEKADRDENTPVNQVTDSEESANKGTGELKAAGQQPDGLFETKDSSGEDEDEVRTKAVPAQILDLDTEPAAEPEEEPSGGDKNLNILLEKTADTENVEPESEAETDMFSNIFGEEKEEVNPLMGLINSLPYVTAEELLEDMQGIKTIMQKKTAALK